jgi:ATP-dependent helicase/nuclease subunit B
MNEIQRHFLGWDKPFFPKVSKWLQEHYLDGELGSAKELLVLVSGKATARRLRTLLLNDANRAGRAIELPAIVTPTQCLRLFIPSDLRIANSQCVLLATVAVLKRIPSDQLELLVGARPIMDEDFCAWLRVAKRTWETIRVLSGGGLSTDSTTWPDSEYLQQVFTPEAGQRFSLLHEVQTHVQQIVSQDGGNIFELLQLEMAQGKRSIHIAETKQMVLGGASDIPCSVSLLLNQLLSGGVHVQALIRAPEEEQNGFNVSGILKAEYWNSKTIEIDNEAIQVAGSPSSQSACAVRALSKLANDATVDEITIVSTDEKLIPILQRYIRGQNIECRYSGGSPTSQTAEVLLLSGITTFITTQSYASFAALLRHPDVAKIFSVTEQLLKLLSDYSAKVLPSRLYSSTWFVPQSSRDDYTSLKQLHADVYGLFNRYISLEDSGSTLTKCTTSIRELLLAIYGDKELDRTSIRLKALQKIFGMLDMLDEVPEKVQSSVGCVRISEVMQFILSELEQDTIPELPNTNAIETIGWLEGMATDTPNLIIVGMGADLGGGSNPSDAFLPDSLLDALGLETIDKRLARDTHAVLAMQQARKEDGTISWIVGRKNTEGDPVSPSQLLMRSQDANILASRSSALVVSFENEKPAVPLRYASSELGGGIALPKPSTFAFEPLEELRVTGFRDYISCPYRFWLKHVMKLNAAEEGSTELDAKLYGIFLHKVLQRFGENIQMRDCNDIQVIEKEVLTLLDDIAQEQLGIHINKKIEVQLELARYRLKIFAKHQSKSVNDGWRIICTEKFEDKILTVDGKPFTIRGTIDRIEKNENGEIRVLDYKTGGTIANKAHFNSRTKEWSDLQLPLYRELLTKISQLKDFDLSENNVKLGFFKIADNEESSGIDYLEPKTAVLDNLQPTINKTILAILNSEFSDEPTDPAPRFSELYSWICQDNNVLEESASSNDE